MFMSAAGAAATGQFLVGLVPPAPVPPVPVVPAVPLPPLPPLPAVPGLLLPPPPQLTLAARTTGNTSRGKRAIVATVLTNMRGLQKSLKFLASLTVWVVYTSIVVSCGCKGGSGKADSGAAPTPLED